MTLVAALVLTDPLSPSPATSTKHPSIPLPELEDIMGSRTKDKAYSAFTLSLGGYYNPTGFLLGHIGQEAAYQRLKLGRKIVPVCACE